MKVRIDHEGSRKLWLEARTFRDLCTLGERFVLGEICVFPGWNAPDLDLESDEIEASLVRLARGGFLTCASQPARTDQRAFVAGFVAQASTRKFASVPPVLDVRLFPPRAVDENEVDRRVDIARYGSSKVPGGDEVLLSRLPREGPPGSEPVSRAGGRFHAFAGHDARLDELETFEGEIGRDAFAELQSAIYVAAFDPEWGRRELLWSELTRALEIE